jgi:Holliday junction resolvase RusA-like endonuclease
MSIDAPFDIEAVGAKSGLNPMFGEWRRGFNHAPVPHGNGAVLKELRKKVHAELTNQFLFSNEIAVTFTLYMDVQTILETSETADIDNYAKGLLDCLRGANGIMIDDTQVQALTISWLDSHETFFEVEIRGSPDDFVLKPIELYEMSDGLWYPLGRQVWDDGSAKDQGEFSLAAGLLITDAMAAVQKGARKELRNAGLDRLRTYQASRRYSTSARGFHKSRVADAGFPLHERKAWQERLATWRAAHPQLAEVETMMSELRAKWHSVALAHGKAVRST